MNAQTVAEGRVDDHTITASREDDASPLSAQEQQKQRTLKSIGTVLLVIGVFCLLIAVVAYDQMRTIETTWYLALGEGQSAQTLAQKVGKYGMLGFALVVAGILIRRTGK